MKTMRTPDGHPMILIVDDTPTNIQVLAEALRADYRVKVATSGKAALAIAGNPDTRPDLILLDVMMPEMDGYEVCRRLKQEPATKNIPVIFVTAKNDVADEELGLRLGAMDYIVKPFHPAIVKARVRGNMMDFTTMTVYKLGANYQASNKLVLRAGYNHGKQPIPSGETFLNILAPGVVEDHVTLGATWAIDSKSEISLSYMHAFKNTVYGNGGAIPASYGGGSANLYMYQDTLGIAYGLRM